MDRKKEEGEGGGESGLAGECDEEDEENEEEQEEEAEGECEGERHASCASVCWSAFSVARAEAMGRASSQNRLSCLIFFRMEKALALMNSAK